MDITISPCASQSYLWWDTVWDQVSNSGDWALAGPTETGNVGGLQATAAIETAVILSLFTDRACPVTHPLFKYADGDPRGWWGDGVPLDGNDKPMGSLLWLLERAVATEDIGRWAEVFALDALSGLKTQGVCTLITAKATVYPANRGLELDVGLFGANGTAIFNRKYAILWRQVH